MIDERKALEHPAYNGSLQRAAQRAYDAKDTCFTVYYDGESIFVRASVAAPPLNSVVLCIAQFWSDSTVQLRFKGGRSEWKNF